MTRIFPFRGWRYDLHAAGVADLAELVTPPYDVISPAQQAAFYARHADNIIRLELTQDQPGDGDTANRYTRAAATLADWQGRGVLRQEASPAIYLLQQRTTLPNGQIATRRGLIFRLRLAPWGEGILPHERTFPAAKADRLALTIATGAQCSPIFLLYSDPAGVVQAPLARTLTEPPVAQFTDDDGTNNALWAITDPALLAALTTALEPKTFYLADGHHRYETARTYQRWQRGGGQPEAVAPAPLSSWQAVPGYVDLPAAPPEIPLPFDTAWVYAACMEDAGVVILPTHRCIHDVVQFTATSLLAGLNEDFTVVSGQTEGATFVLVLPDNAGDVVYYGLYRRETPATAARVLADYPAPVAAVDVAILQSLVLGPLLGINPDPTELKRFVAFTPRADEAVAGVAAGRFQAAFLVNPTPLAQLQAVSDAGEVMPPKATYFYPKLPAGLVVNWLGSF
ncbi:MAG: DUF1015 domain-containing protein [Anaerolineae bacterium]